MMTDANQIINYTLFTDDDNKTVYQGTLASADAGSRAAIVANIAQHAQKP